MTGFSGVGFSAVMVVAGIGIPIMAALNSGLGERIDNPVQAAAMLFGLAALVSLVVLAVQPKPIELSLTRVPVQYFLGGLFVAFYVHAVTFAAPVIGVGNAIVLVLLGQMCAAAAIDHFGWLQAQQTPLTMQRVLGLASMAVGVVLMRRPVELS